jgi:hypothetical protein
MFLILMIVMATCSMTKVEPTPAPAETRVEMIVTTTP